MEIQIKIVPMEYINKIKLAVRVLLPLIVFGISWCMNWLYELLVYGGFEQMYKNGLIDDSSIIATHLFMGLFYFIILPFIYIIHGLLCLLNNRFNFVNIRLAIILSTILTVALYFFSRSTDPERNIQNIVEITILIFPSVLLYFYGLNLTKKKL